MKISFVIGDATEPIGVGPKLIVHVCNDAGGWGRGFVMAISKRWPGPEQRYREWHRGDQAPNFALGEIQTVQVAGDLWVVNLVGQHDVRTIGGIPPVRYEAIRKGLRSVAEEARRKGASVHMPRIGCGLAGGSWDEVGRIVEEELAARGISVTVYDLPPQGTNPSQAPL